MKTRICERGNDLIAFLYQEASDREAKEFQQHLASCAECERELHAFRGIRDGVVVWRQESLGMLPARVNSPAMLRSEKPSALVAIRQFFDLSPLWLKGAVACAAVLFCVAVVLVVAGVGDQPQSNLVRDDKVYSEKEMQAKVEQEIRGRLQQLNRIPENAPREIQPAVTAQNAKPKLREAVGYTAKTRRAPLTRSEREELAADLRLISPREDSDLDLLGEELNR